MDSLPKKTILMIGQWLPPQALAAWSATSHHWRDVFNQDKWWKRYCDPSLVDYLLNTSCVVEPGFVSPKVAGSGLKPLCEWRLHYMRQNHLWKNWKNGRYSRKQICFEDNESYLYLLPEAQLSDKNVAKATFYNEDFFIGHLNSRIEVWDLRGDALLYMENPCSIFSNLKVLALYIYGDKLVVVQRVIVLVFQISLTSKTWPLLHVFFMHHEEKCSLHEAKRIVKEEVSVNYLFNGTMVEDLFIGIKSCREDKMHIWNIDSGIKVKEAECEDQQQWYIHSVYPGVSTKNVVVTMVNRDDLSSYLMKRFKDPKTKPTYNDFKRVMIYNLKELSFLSFVFNSENDSPKSMINEKFIAISTKNGCLVYNYQTQNLIAEVPKFNCAQFVNDTIMFSDDQGLKQMVFSTKENKHILDSDDSIKSLDLISDRFTALLVSPSFESRRNCMDIIQILRNDTQDFWEIGIPLRCLSPFPMSSSGINTTRAVQKLEVNQTFTKMVYKCGSPLEAYYFW